MAKSNRIDPRAWLVASVIAGVSFWLVKDAALGLPLKMVWKGAGVALLAIYALASGAGSDARRLALVMTLGATGDVLIELHLQLGAGAFMFGHLAAMNLYIRHRRETTTGSQNMLAAALLIGTPLIAWLLPADRSQAWPVAIYALVLGGMAGTAWTSSFPRYRVGIGAVVFVASDLLIFAQMGPLADSAVPDLLVWPLYYFGQFLICVGVIGTLRKRSA